MTESQPENGRPLTPEECHEILIQVTGGSHVDRGTRHVTGFR